MPQFRGKGSDEGADPFRGSFSEVRLWRRCLADDELATPINASAPPDDLVRWLCLTDEDAEHADGTVRNCAPHGPPVMTVGSTSKPKYTSRTEEGETDADRVGPACAVPRHVNRLLAFAIDLKSVPLLDHLVAKEPSLKAALAAPEVLLGALVPRCAAAALRLLSAYDLPISAPVCDRLLEDASGGKGSPFQARAPPSPPPRAPPSPPPRASSLAHTTP